MSGVKYVLSTYLKLLGVEESTAHQMLQYVENHKDYPSLRSIVECCENWRFEPTAATATIDQLRSLSGYFLVFLESPHPSFALVLRMDQGEILYLTGQGQLILEPDENFQKKWNSVVFIAEITSNTLRGIGDPGAIDAQNVISIADIKKVAYNQVEPLTYKIYRPLSVYFSFAFARIGISPNLITILWLVVSISAAVTLSLSISITARLIFIMLIILHFILDCSDGEVARITNKTSRGGNYLEQISHWLSNCALVIAISIASFHQNKTSFPLIIGLFCLAADTSFHFIYIQLNYWINPDFEYKSLYKVTTTVYALMPLNINLCLLGCALDRIYLSLLCWCALSSILFILMSITFFSTELFTKPKPKN